MGNVAREELRDLDSFIDWITDVTERGEKWLEQSEQPNESSSHIISKEVSNLPSIHYNDYVNVYGVDSDNKFTDQLENMCILIESFKRGQFNVVSELSSAGALLDSDVQEKKAPLDEGGNVDSEKSRVESGREILEMSSAGAVDVQDKKAPLSEGEKVDSEISTDIKRKFDQVLGAKVLF
jgi:hypothetical protein